MWAIAIWTPKFTQFMHDYLKAIARQHISASGSLIAPRPELPIGDVIQAAIEQGFRVEAEVFENGSYLDIGTPENLAKAIREVHEDNW